MFLFLFASTVFAASTDGLVVYNSFATGVNGAGGLGAKGDLKIYKSDPAAGIIKSDDGFISCGAVCSHNYELGSTITLSVLPSSNAEFLGWSGGGCSGTGPCTVTLSDNTSVTADFATIAQPADKISALTPYPYSEPHNVNDGKIPLILVHGIYQTEDLNHNGKLDNNEAVGQDSGWKDFLDYYQNNTSLKEKYKLYMFQYLSDIKSVHQIGKSLRNYIEEAINRGEFDETGYVLLAHSMGGLVSRSFIQEDFFNTGEKCGERVKHLITLATPHHGSPGANDKSVIELLKNADRHDRSYRKWWGLNNNWQHTWRLGSRFYWSQDGSYISYNKPNRKDLLWDNFDNVMKKSNNDINVWLQNLNKDTTYDSKITLFYGSLDIESAGYKNLVDQVYSRIQLSNGPSSLYTATVQGDEHTYLLAGSILMNYGLYKNNKSPYVWNDGMVPLQSGAFNGHTVNEEMSCPDHDHLDMLGANSDKKCISGKSLLESVGDSLLGIAQP